MKGNTAIFLDGNCSKPLPLTGLGGKSRWDNVEFLLQGETRGELEARPWWTGHWLAGAGVVAALRRSTAAQSPGPLRRRCQLAGGGFL